MKRGPPPASPDGARNRRLSIPVTDAERERLRAAAGSAPLTAWCRGVVMERAALARDGSVALTGDQVNAILHLLNSMIASREWNALERDSLEQIKCLLLGVEP